MCYIVYNALCFIGLNACMWVVYDLGFKETIRPVVWTFVSVFLSITILAGIHFAKELLREF